MTQTPIGAAYLSADGFEPDLAEELRLSGRSITAWHGRLALSPEPPAPMVWALEAWTDPRELPAPSVKAAADIYAPLSGEIVASNDELADAPERVNQDPYDAWLFRIRPADPAEFSALLDAAAYEKLAESDK